MIAVMLCLGGLLSIGLLLWSLFSIFMFGRMALFDRDQMERSDWFWLVVALFFNLPLSLWNGYNFYEFVLKP